MSGATVASLLLRLRLVLMRAGAPACGVALLLVLACAGWALVVRQRLSLPVAAPARIVVAPASVARVVAADQNLAAFYALLGERRYAEQQVKTLFALAAKTGLSLEQGEYKFAVERTGRFSTWQVLLPVKGSYSAIWQFAARVLRTVPFAALDDISLRRENIGQPLVEARLRFSFYLDPPDAGVPP